MGAYNGSDAGGGAAARSRWSGITPGQAANRGAAAADWTRRALPNANPRAGNVVPFPPSPNDWYTPKPPPGGPGPATPTNAASEGGTPAAPAGTKETYNPTNPVAGPGGVMFNRAENATSGITTPTPAPIPGGGVASSPPPYVGPTGISPTPAPPPALPPGYQMPPGTPLPPTPTATPSYINPVMGPSIAPAPTPVRPRWPITKTRPW